MSFGLVAIGIGTAVAGTAGAVSSSISANKANKANIANAKSDREANYLMFREGRGSDGNALLPLYFDSETPEYAALNKELARLTDLETAAINRRSSAKDKHAYAAATREINSIKSKILGINSQRDALVNTGRDKVSFEKGMSGDARAIYEAVNRMSPEQRLAAYEQSIGKMRPAQDAAMDYTGAMFDRRLLNDELADLNQFATRAKGVKAQGWKEALQETLGNINMTMRRKGYSGDSYGSNLLGFEARRRMYGDLADFDVGIAEAELQRKDANRARMGANLSLPFTMAQTGAKQVNMPNRLLMDDADAANKFILGNFGIQPGAFKYDRLPDVQPNSTGSAIAAGIGSGLNQVGGIIASNRQTELINNALRSGQVANNAAASWLSPASQSWINSGAGAVPIGDFNTPRSVIGLA